MPLPADNFDPYAAWLGIAPSQRPLTHYLLLGLPRFESDLHKIAAAADERMGLVRQYQQGPRSAWSQKVLNELAAARVCLLNPAARASYDTWLTAMAPSAGPTNAGPPPMAKVLGTAPSGPAPAARMLGAPPIAPPVAAPPKPPPKPGAPVSEPEPEAVTAPAPWGLAGLVLLGIVLVVAPVVWWYRRPTLQPAAVIAEPHPYEISLTEESDPTEPAPEMPDDLPILKSAVVLQQETDGAVNFTPATAVLEGGVELAVEGTDNVLTNWTASEDVIRWRFRLVEPAIFRVHITYSADEAAAGGRFVVRVEEADKTVTIRTADKSGETVTDTFFLTIKRSGEHVLTLQGLNRAGKEFCTLRSLRIVPPKREPRKPTEAEE